MRTLLVAGDGSNPDAGIQRSGAKHGRLPFLRACAVLDSSCLMRGLTACVQGAADLTIFSITFPRTCLFLLASSVCLLPIRFDRPACARAASTCICPVVVRCLMHLPRACVCVHLSCSLQTPPSRSARTRRSRRPFLPRRTTCCTKSSSCCSSISTAQSAFALLYFPCGLCLPFCLGMLASQLRLGGCRWASHSPPSRHSPI